MALIFTEVDLDTITTQEDYTPLVLAFKALKPGKALCITMPRSGTSHNFRCAVRDALTRRLQIEVCTTVSGGKLYVWRKEKTQGVVDRRLSL